MQAAWAQVICGPPLSPPALPGTAAAACCPALPSSPGQLHGTPTHPPARRHYCQVAALTQLVTLDLDCPHEARLHPPALQLPLLPRLRWLRCWLPAKGAPGVTLPGQLHDAFVAALAGSCPQLETLQVGGAG